MARSAAARTTETNPGKAPVAVKNTWGLAAQGKRKRELDDLGPIIRITKTDIITLRDLCATLGSVKVAADIGVAEVTLLRAMSGLGEHCIPRTTECLRDFLKKLNS